MLCSFLKGADFVSGDSDHYSPGPGIENILFIIHNGGTGIKYTSYKIKCYCNSYEGLNRRKRGFSVEICVRAKSPIRVLGFIYGNISNKDKNEINVGILEQNHCANEKAKFAFQFSLEETKRSFSCSNFFRTIILS